MNRLKYKKNIMTKTIFIISLIITITSCNKEVTNEPVVDISIVESSLAVISKPVGAKIYIDGRYSGFKTPDTLNNFEEGTYEILLKRPLYSDTTFIISLKEKEKRIVDIDYNSNLGMLGFIRCNTIPEGADIYINDSLTGEKTPYLFKQIIPGDYRVKFSKVGCRDDSSIAHVESKVTGDSFKHLRDTTVFVDYITKYGEMPSDYITDIVIDREGIIWMTSLDKGLIKFDGKEFNTYSIDLGLEIYYMNLLKVMGNSIVVSSNDGIIRFYDNTYNKYNKENSILVSNYINDMVIIRNKLWLANGSNVINTDFNSWKKYNRFILNESPLVIDTSTVFKVSRLKKYDQIIISTQRGSLSLIDKKWKKFPPNYPQFDIKVNYSNTRGSILYDLDDYCWILNESSLRVLRNLTIQKINIISDASRAHEIYIDRNNVKWVSTNNGLYEFTDWDLDRKKYIAGQSSLSSNNVSAVVLDHSNNAWIATLGGGLLKYKRNLIPTK